MDFEVKQCTLAEKGLPVNIYISLSTNTVNPLLLKEELKLFVNYMREKYSTPEIKPFSFKEYVLKMFKNSEK
jgi:hypothetical protein